MTPPSPLTHLQQLEARSIHLLREAVAQARRPVLLLGSGPRSQLLQRLAARAFHPALVPLPLRPIGPGGLPAEAQALQQALLQQGFDLAIVADPPDPLRSPPSPISPISPVSPISPISQAQPGLADPDPGPDHAGGPKPASPALWPIYNLRPRPGEAVIVLPLDAWTDADILRHGQPAGPASALADDQPAPADGPPSPPTGFRLTVQSVHAVGPAAPADPPAVQINNPKDADQTCYAVVLSAGCIRPGDALQALPSGQAGRVARLIGPDGDLPQAQAGQAVMLTLCDPLGLQRGDLLCPAAAATTAEAANDFPIGAATDTPAQVAHQFDATLHWLGEQPLLRGRAYLLHTGARTVTATVLPLKYRLDPVTHDHLAAETLARGDVGVAELDLDTPVPFDPPAHHPGAGRFILIDRISQATVATGQLNFALRRASNIHWQAVSVDRAARQRLNGHGSAVVWLTGLSGAGKSTIANLLEKRLHADGQRTYLLDGDNVRHGLNKDLGFTAADRVENIRRVAEVARLMADAGLIVVTAFISPFRAERAMARALMGDVVFTEVHVHTPLAVAESRDPKGLYRKARRGELKNFTGIDSPYEAPESPDLRLDTSLLSAEAAVAQVHALLQQRGVLDPR